MSKQQNAFLNDSLGIEVARIAENNQNMCKHVINVTIFGQSVQALEVRVFCVALVSIYVIDVEFMYKKH